MLFGSGRFPLIPVENVKNFERKIVGRPRQNALAWRISSVENTQFVTFISVQIQLDQEKRLTQRLEEIRRSGRHVFPGTVMRYVVRSLTIPRQVDIALAWRSTVMPGEAERKLALEEFRQMLADVLDWSTASYNNGEVLMHT